MAGALFDVRISQRAWNDMEEICAWYESQEAWDAAIAVPAAILKVIDAMAVHPDAGAVGLSGRRERILVDLPYRIVYVAEARCVTIHAIVHTRRQWPATAV